MAKFNELALTKTDFYDITFVLSDDLSPEHYSACLITQGNSIAEIEAHWACLLRWLSTAVPGMVPLNRHAQRHLNAQFAKIAPAFAQEVEEKLSAAFPSIVRTAWGDTAGAEKSTMLSRFKKLVTGTL